MMRLYEIEPLLQEIRALVHELRQLEGDGADRLTLTARKRELDELRARLADLVSHDPRPDYRTAA